MRWGSIAALVIAAAISVFNVISFQLDNLLRPTSPLMNSAISGTVGAILILTIGALVLVWWVKKSTAWVVIVIALVLVAGFVPRVLDVAEKREAQAIRDDDNRRIEIKMNFDIESRKRDVEERISAREPYLPAEALTFVEFVVGSDLRYRSLPDHSDVAFALLQRALEHKIVDPNGLVKGVRPVDVNMEPLFLHFYRVHVRPTTRGPIRIRDFRLLQLLAAYGADLSTPGAERVVEDLRKMPKPIENMRDFVDLD